MVRGKIYRGRSSHQNVKIQDLLQLFRNLFYQKEMKARSEALKTLEIKIKYSLCIWDNQNSSLSLHCREIYTNRNCWMMMKTFPLVLLMIFLVLSPEETVINYRLANKPAKAGERYQLYRKWSEWYVVILWDWYITPDNTTQYENWAPRTSNIPLTTLSPHC